VSSRGILKLPYEWRRPAAVAVGADPTRRGRRSASRRGSARARAVRRCRRLSTSWGPPCQTSVRTHQLGQVPRDISEHGDEIMPAYRPRSPVQLYRGPARGPSAASRQDAGGQTGAVQRGGRSYSGRRRCASTGSARGGPIYWRMGPIMARRIRGCTYGSAPAARLPRLADQVAEHAVARSPRLPAVPRRCASDRARPDGRGLARNMSVAS